MVSERMFHHIKNGKHLRKETVLALLIVMELSVSEIQVTLKKAGFVLSNAIARDVVIMWLLENELDNKKGEKRLLYINDKLYALELPLLTTRSKE